MLFAEHMLISTKTEQPVSDGKTERIISQTELLTNSTGQDTAVTNLDKPESKKKRITKRVSVKKNTIFGRKLYLVMGKPSNLYRDITDLYQFYEKNKANLSSSFPNLIRMSLRLLCETAD